MFWLTNLGSYLNFLYYCEKMYFFKIWILYDSWILFLEDLRIFDNLFSWATVYIFTHTLSVCDVIEIEGPFLVTLTGINVWVLKQFKYHGHPSSTNYCVISRCCTSCCHWYAWSWSWSCYCCYCCRIRYLFQPSSM